MGASWIANTATVIILPTDFMAGDFWVGVLQAVAAVIGFTMFVALRLRPRRFVVIIQVTLGVIFFIQLVITALLGGLLASGLEVVFGLIMVLAVLIGDSAPTNGRKSPRGRKRPWPRWRWRIGPTAWRSP